MKFISTLEIAKEGLVGVRLGASGNVNTMAYKTTKDGRFSFNKDAWKNFVETTNLSVGQAILITGKKDSQLNLEMMFVMNIIIHSSQALAESSESNSD